VSITSIESYPPAFKRHPAACENLLAGTWRTLSNDLRDLAEKRRDRDLRRHRTTFARRTGQNYVRKLFVM